MEELGHRDAALLCTPTRSVEETALPLLARGINTVDSFDIHGDIVALRRSLGAQAIKHDAVSIISAGWDPGTDSVIRTLMLAMAPKGITYTNFGPGMSMGHSVVARSKEGVADALSPHHPHGFRRTPPHGLCGAERRRQILRRGRPLNPIPTSAMTTPACCRCPTSTC